LSINTLSPAPRIYLAEDTGFAWQAVSGAKAYQLEFYAPAAAAALLKPGSYDDSQTPVSGLLVPASQNQASISPIARRHLAPGQTYFWRVLAIDERGRLLGASELQAIYTP